ncbi:hypothetical protein BC832DRAFT_589077 [Gaertneriomyces semiglobifer]|nr:hypothetical protein BC832DRAFT_589077 [Gaertneriomyces semiglobifer]
MARRRRLIIVATLAVVTVVLTLMSLPTPHMRYLTDVGLEEVGNETHSNDSSTPVQKVEASISIDCENNALGKWNATLDNPEASWQFAHFKKCVLPGLKKLVVVPGHAVFVGSDFRNLSEKNWATYSYQHGQTPLYVEHIMNALDILIRDPETILVFSGGQTRPLAGSLSEAESYLRIALAQLPSLLNTTTIPPALKFRMLTDSYSVTSLQNTLFPVCRFKAYASRYPEFVTVSGFEHKRRRFEELHRKAIKYPRLRYEYISSNGTLERELGLKDLMYDIYVKDLYGCRIDYKNGRDPFENFGAQLAIPDCEEVQELVDFCPEQGSEGQVYGGRLPWERTIEK